MLGLSGADTSYLIQMCFFTCGIATIIQTGIGIKLPVVQGASFVALSALAAIGSTNGMPTLIGSLIPGAIILCLLGVTKIFSKIVNKCVPAYIGGPVSYTHLDVYKRQIQRHLFCKGTNLCNINGIFL